MMAGNGTGHVYSSGQLDCPGTCSTSVDPGSTIVLTAVADSGSRFEGFSSECAAGSPCTLSPVENVIVQATFVANPPTPPRRKIAVTISGSGSGTVKSTPAGIACPGTCSGSFATDVPVSLEAIPDKAMTFSGWGGACTGTATCVISPGANDGDVSATFGRTADALWAPVYVPPRVASSQACHVGVPRTRSSLWPGWSEIAALESYRMTHAVDGSGAIHLAEWKDGIVVRRDDGRAWQASETLALPTVFWAFATDRNGHDFVARATGKDGDASLMRVEVSASNGAGWSAFGDPLPAGHVDIYNAVYSGMSALSIDPSGRLLLAFHNGEDPPPGKPYYGLRSFRWDGAWTDLGGIFVLPGGKILLAPAGSDGFFATSAWDLRRSANLGCHEAGAHALAYDGVGWRDLGELKRDLRLDESSGCPYTNLSDTALTLDQNGRPLIAFIEAGQVHLVRWSGTAFEPLTDFPASTAGLYYPLRSSLSLVRLASGDLWLSWIAADSPGAGLFLYRLRDGAWHLVDELRSTGSEFNGSLVCVDEDGNPVVEITDVNGGHLLYRRL
jgi:hypothetical protein